jgi:hypothetical protein
MAGRKRVVGGGNDTQVAIAPAGERTPARMPHGRFPLVIARELAANTLWIGASSHPVPPTLLHSIGMLQPVFASTQATASVLTTLYATFAGRWVP